MIFIKKTNKKIKKHMNKFSNSTFPKSNSLDSYELNNNSKCSSNNHSIELKKNYDNYVDSKDILDTKDINKENNNINFLGKKTKVSFCITKKPKQNHIFFISKFMKNKDNLFFQNFKNKDPRKICQKKKLFQTNKFFYQDDHIKTTNRGKWSYEEQKYIGSRICNQIISHAQKFFLRLKELKSDKYCFNFKKTNIQSLSNVINIIARSN